MPNELILLVDDEANILQLASMYLEREGFRILTVGDGLGVFDILKNQSPALIVLDVMLPSLDGFEVCRRLRAEGSQIPIIMLTARDEDIDKILGLELGADDYLTKPFNPRELVARIKAILRRFEPRSQPTGDTLQPGDLLIDLEKREVWCQGKPIHLRTQEFEVLLVLAGSPRRVFNREQLLNLAWGYDFAGDTRTVDVHIAQLRRKLEKSRVRIETVTGIGYKLVVE
jgi:two-component system alkaline phosphatase synthesis response regulator PhoP